MADACAVSAIIACSRPARVERTLAALAAQRRPDRVEVIVAGELPEQRGAWPFEVTYVRCATAHPNARRNLAIERARAPRLAFLDDDAEPADGWLDAACDLSPDAHVLRTGPELPARTSEEARLAHRVLASLGELGGGHHHEQRGSVPWYAVPFCNLLTTRALWDLLGPLPIDVPWDCDDFELAHRARSLARFEADPSLRIRHDRYPDTHAELLLGVWQRRVRTGAKLVEAPDLYWRIPEVALCALAPAAMVLAPAAAPVAALAYTAWIARAARAVRAELGDAGARRFVTLAVTVHAATVLGVQWGFARAVAARVTSALDPGAQA